MRDTLRKYTEKYEKILKTAERLFLKEGYKNTSMDTVAAEAAVTKQTVYRYFDSKKTLLEAVLEDFSKKSGMHVFGDGKTEDELMGFAVGFVKMHLLPERLGFYRLAVAESGEVGEILRRVSQSVRTAGLAEFLEERLSPRDPYKDAECYIAMLLSIRYPVLMGLTPVPDDESVRGHCLYVTDIFLRGSGGA